MPHELAGTFPAVPTTSTCVRCERFREAVSARLDDEPLGMSAGALDGHLATCPDCARWAEAAAQATRFARLDVRPVPDISEHITLRVARPARKVARRRQWLRVLLAFTGLVQLGIGIPALTGDSIGMAMSAHGTHEMAAWNLAIGVALLGAAWLPRRAAGLVPLLGVFLAVLIALSVHDVATGEVGLDRLATHLAVLAGLVLLVALERTERAMPPPAPQVLGTERGSGDPDAPLRTVA